MLHIIFYQGIFSNFADIPCFLCKTINSKILYPAPKSSSSTFWALDRSVSGYITFEMARLAGADITLAVKM